MTKTLSILGSTGSIGRQTLDVVRQHPDRFQVEVITAQTSSYAARSYLQTIRST